MRQLAIGLIPLILLALVVSAIGCGGEEEATPTPPPTPTMTSTPTSTATPVAGFLTYNDVVNGFSVSYPEDWDLIEDLAVVAVLFAGPILEDDYMVNVSITVEEIFTFSASDYARMSALRMQREYEDFKKVQEYETTVDGYDAIVMVIDATVFGFELRDKIAFVVKDEIGYSILYDISRDYHDQYVYVFDELIQTFKFQ